MVGQILDTHATRAARRVRLALFLFGWSGLGSGMRGSGMRGRRGETLLTRMVRKVRMIAGSPFTADVADETEFRGEAMATLTICLPRRIFTVL